jgi:hypothetical protein
MFYYNYELLFLVVKSLQQKVLNSVHFQLQLSWQESNSMKRKAKVKKQDM